MRPGDHPEFFRMAPPPGASRQSTIRLDGQGRFWHDGGLVENAALCKALHQWISRHPDNGRYILTNGYDWVYFDVEDVPYFVVAARVQPDGIELELSDGTRERMSGDGIGVSGDGALLVAVKAGEYRAKFTRHAQMSLHSVVEEGEGGSIQLRIGDRLVVVPGC